MSFWPIVANWLALALSLDEHIYQGLAKEKSEYQSSKESTPCPKRDVAKQIEEVATIRERSEPV
jgi:hypothetical protein